MISESQEPIKEEVQSKEIEKLELDLIKKKQRVATVTQKIEFRPKGANSKWTEELIKSKAEVQDIINRINLLKRIEDDKITEVFLKDYEEKEKIFEEERVLAEERKKAFTLFEEYKNGEYLKNKPAEFKTTPKPNFDHIGVKNSREIQEALRLAQTRYNSIKLKSEGRSSAYSGKYTSDLTKARNNLNLIALRDAENEPILIENEVMKAEIEWKETILTEMEAYRKDMEAYIDKQEKELTLFVKHGLIESKIKK